VGLAGHAAERALELTEDEGTEAFLSAPGEAEAGGEVRVAAATSEGPTYDLAPKPDLAADGVARTAVPGGGRALAAGTSVAAARVAAQAARLRAARPRWSPREAAAALVGTARAVGRAGAALRAPALADAAAAAAAPVLAAP